MVPGAGGFDAVLNMMRRTGIVLWFFGWALLCAWTHTARGAANDVVLDKRNSGDTGFEAVTLADPGADRWLMWDDDAGTVVYDALSGFLASGAIDTFAELDALVADVSMIHAGSLDTMAELQALVADATVLDATAIDTLAELNAILGDATLVDGVEAGADVTDAANVTAALAADVVRYESDGTITLFNAAADTDDDRGDALIDATDDAGAGDVVVMSGQTFHVDRGVDLASGVELRGQGASSLIYADYVGASNGCVITAGFSGSGYTGVVDLVVRDLAIEVPTGFFNGIAVAHGSRIVIENITATLGSGANTFHAVDVIGCQDVLVRNVRATTGADNALVQIDQSVSGAATGWNGSSTYTMAGDNTSSSKVSVVDCFLRTTANNTRMVHIHRDGHEEISVVNLQAEGGLYGVLTDDDSELDGLVVSGGQ